MRKPVAIGCGLLLAAALVGCGSSDDTILKEKIGIMNEMSAILEKVKDEASAKEGEGKMDDLQKKADDIKAKVKDWSKEKQEEMKKKYESELKAAGERFTKAFSSAMTKGLKLTP